MKYWLLVGMAVFAETNLAQRDEGKEVRSQAPVLWQDSTPWGKPVTGVRMSVEGLHSGDGQLRGLRIAFQNISSFPQALSLGFLSSTGAQIPATLALTTPSGSYEFTGVSSRAATGGIDPLVIPLVMNAAYVVHMPLTAFRPVRTKPSRNAAITEATELSVRFIGDSAVCDANGYPHPNPVPCWSGELKSNVIRLSPR
jgi:hypothetical protein